LRAAIALAEDMAAPDEAPLSEGSRMAESKAGFLKQMQEQRYG
jgi:hypothetical protein